MLLLLLLWPENIQKFEFAADRQTNKQIINVIKIITICQPETKNQLAKKLLSILFRFARQNRTLRPQKSVLVLQTDRIVAC